MHDIDERTISTGKRRYFVFSLYAALCLLLGYLTFFITIIDFDVLKDMSGNQNSIVYRDFSDFQFINSRLTDNGIVTDTGDPQLVISKVNENVKYVMIEFDSPVKNMWILDVFCTNSEVSNFGKINRKWFCSGSETRILLPLKLEVQKLRLDFGNESGRVFQVKSIVINPSRADYLRLLLVKPFFMPSVLFGALFFVFILIGMGYICRKDGKTNYLLAFLVFLTIIRIVLQMQIPLFFRGPNIDDDYLMVKYANSLMSGNWLGKYDEFTLLKTISFPIYLLIGHILNIPYVMSQILFYIFSISILAFVLRAFIKNRIALALFYVFLLFSPIMYTLFVSQRVYRNGILVCATVTVIAAVVGIFVSRDKSRKELFLYSLLASVALPFFFYIKEDSIWLLPFPVCASIITILCLLKEQRTNFLFHRILMVLFPLAALFSVHVAYSCMNYLNYGVYTITDRSGTNFKNVMSDLIHIEDGNKDPAIWLTIKAVHMAMDVSPTLARFRPEFDNLMKTEGWNRTSTGFKGDYYIWNLRRHLFSKGGVYAEGGAAADKFYAEIHKELSSAFSDGVLSRKKAFYPSSISKGIERDDISFFTDSFKSYMKRFSTYSDGGVRVIPPIPPLQNVAEMIALTKSSTSVFEINPQKTKMPPQKLFMKVFKWLQIIYQKTGLLLLIMGFTGLLFLTGKVFVDLLKHKFFYFDAWLILFGLLGVGSVQFFGVLWYLRFRDGVGFCTYTAPNVPILQILEFAGVYVIFAVVKNLWAWLKTCKCDLGSL